MGNRHTTIHPSPLCERCWLMGTRLDTGHSICNFLPRLEQRHLQGDKDCVPGDRGAGLRQEAVKQAKR